MSPAATAAQEARTAIVDALWQLWTAVLTPAARIDAEARNGYLELHTQTAAIVQRLGEELHPAINELDGQQQAIANNVAGWELERHAAAAAPLDAAALRIKGEILAATKGALHGN